MKWNQGAQFEDPKPGSYIARCYALVDLGTQPHEYMGVVSQQRKVRISFELPTEKMTGKYNKETKGKPFSVHWTGKQSLHPKSNLRALLKGWRGRDFTAEELKGFDPKKLVSAACRLALVASEDGSRVFVNSASPLGKGEKCPKQVNPSVFLSLEPNEFDNAVFESLHEGTQKKIQQSPEYQALVGGDQQPDPPEHTPAEGDPEAASDPDADNVPF